MTDQPAPDAKPIDSGASARNIPPKKKRRWLRRSLWLSAIAIVLLIALVVLLPTLASTGAVRSFAVGQVNSRIVGKLEVGAWSFGWFSPTSIRGVKLFDKNNALIFEADEIKTDATLSQLARQQFKFGDTVVDANLARLQIRPDGTTNLTEAIALKSASAAVPASRASANSQSGESKQLEPVAPMQDIALPDLSVVLTLKLRGTIELLDDAGRVSSVVQLRQGSGGTVNVPNINQLVTSNLKFVYDVDNKLQGTVTLAGGVSAIKQNRLAVAALSAGDLSTLIADVTLGLSSVDLSALKPALTLAGRPDSELAGVADGTIKIKADGNTAAGIDGKLSVKDFSVTDLALNGDTLAFATVDLPIKITRTGNGAAAQIQSEQVRLTTPAGFVDFACDFGESALRNLADGRAPGSNGWLSVTTDFPGLGGLAKQLKNTAKLRDDVTLTQGRFADRLDVTFLPEQVVTKNRLDVELAGTDSTGQVVALKPVTVTTDLSLTPGANGFLVLTPAGAREVNTTTLVRGLNDFAVVVVSDFADIRAGGKTFTSLAAKGTIDLGKLHAQLAQFRTMDDLKLAGRANFDVSTNGDVVTPGSNVKVSAGGGVDGIDVTLPGQPRATIGFVKFNSDATLVTGGDSFFAAIKSAAIAFSAGEKTEAPLAQGKLKLTDFDPATTSVKRFDLENIQVVNLPTLTRMASPFVPALAANQIDITAGEIYASGGGSFDGKTMTLDVRDRPLSFSTPNLTITKAGKRLLTKENIRGELGGIVGLPNTGINARIDKLSFSSTFLTISKSPEPFVLAIEGEHVTGGGSVPISADLIRLNEIATALGTTPVATTTDGLLVPTPGPTPQVRGGKFDGTLKIVAANATTASVQFDGAVKQLTIALGDAVALQDETINVSASAQSDNSFKTLSAAANVKSSFVSAIVKDTALDLSPTATGALDQLVRANVTLGVADMAKLHAIIKAFVPSENASPMRITSGGASMTLAVARDVASQTTTIKLTDGAISKLALRNGDYVYAFDKNKPINFGFDAVVKAGAAIDEVRVNTLALDAGVVSVSMPETLTLSGLSGKTPTAKGKVVIAGSLGNLAPVLSALNGTPPMTYAGVFRIEQAVATTTGGGLSLVGSGGIDQFVVKDEAGATTFNEPKITFANDVLLDLTAGSASINNVSLSMPSSGALDLKVTGAIKDWTQRRQILPGTMATVKYDLEKLWPIVYASMSPEQQKTYATAKARGKYESKFNLGGSFPAMESWQDSIQSLTFDGRLAVEMFDGGGITLGSPALDLGLNLSKGRLVTDAQPAGLNGGRLDLGGIVVSFTDDIRIDIPKNTRLLNDVSINKLLGDNLGKYINPVFANAERAKGLLNVRVEYCRALAIGEKLETPESGKAQFALSVVDMDIANPVGSLIAGPFLSKVGKSDFASGQADTFAGEIRNGVITIENGRTTQQITMDLARPIQVLNKATGKTVTQTQVMPMSFKGDIRLSDLRQRLDVNIPTELLAALIPDDGTADVVRDVFPSGVPVVMGGTSPAPKVEFGDILGKIGEGLIKSQIRKGLGGKDGDKGKDLIGGLIDQLGKRDKDKK